MKRCIDIIAIKVAIKARLGKYWHLCFDQALPFCQLPSHRWLCCKTWSFLSDRRISPGQFGSPPSLFSGLPLIKKKWRMMNKDCYPVLLLTKYYSWLLYFSINLRWTGSRRLSLIHTCFIYLLLMCGKNLSAARNIRDNESLTKTRENFSYTNKSLFTVLWKCACVVKETSGELHSWFDY